MRNTLLRAVREPEAGFLAHVYLGGERDRLFQGQVGFGGNNLCVK